MSERIKDTQSGFCEDMVYTREACAGKVAKTAPIVTPEPLRKQENMTSKKTEIEIEMNETVAYSSRGERFESFCPTCKCMSEMATSQIAAVLAHTSEREIYKLVETGQVHFVETDRVLVCLSSLDGLGTKGEII